MVDVSMGGIGLMMGQANILPLFPEKVLGNLALSTEVRRLLEVLTAIWRIMNIWMIIFQLPILPLVLCAPPNGRVSKAMT